MAALQKRLSEILTRLRDVNTSQKVALFLGGLLVAVALIWMVQWAAAPEMVPLIDQGLAAEDLALVRSGLDALGEHYEIRGDRILVRAARNRAALYAQLQQQEKLPSDTSVGFAALIKESDPWISSEESRRRWTFALQGELERVLRELNGVRNARVLLNYGTQKRVFARTAPPSSASVAADHAGGRPGAALPGNCRGAARGGSRGWAVREERRSRRCERPPGTGLGCRGRSQHATRSQGARGRAALPRQPPADHPAF
ncbi:MAG: hypothetical protein IPM18_11995 [Phycisphaerales bacterium]|nr:hypothetical protein [Phycisphaerales bacterium]